MNSMKVKMGKGEVSRLNLERYMETLRWAILTLMLQKTEEVTINHNQVKSSQQRAKMKWPRCFASNDLIYYKK